MMEKKKLELERGQGDPKFLWFSVSQSGLVSHGLLKDALCLYTRIRFRLLKEANMITSSGSKLKYIIDVSFVEYMRFSLLGKM